MINYGKSSNELFAQFVARVSIEIPNATLAMFSTLKYINSPNFEKFRQLWSAKYLGGFVVHNKAFDGMSGKFPIGFLIWDANQRLKNTISEVRAEVLNKNVQPIGEKTFYNISSINFLNNWLKRPSSNKIEVIPLKNAVTPASTKIASAAWSDNAIGFMLCDSNDIQHSEQKTSLFSSVYRVGHDGGFYVTPENLWQAAVIFSSRRLTLPTWLNDRDQFLQPRASLSEEFNLDCLIWMLFNRCQRTASANDLEWNGKKWSIVNHFIPFTEAEVGAPDRFESDFMVRYLSGKTLSADANKVLEAGKSLWQAYFAHTDVRAVRDELKLNRADVGWYQVRKALQARNASGDFPPVSFTAFQEAYKILTEKLQPMVYELGFLKA